MKIKFWKSAEQRRIWREIRQMREKQRFHLNCSESYRLKKEALIKQYRLLKR